MEKETKEINWLTLGLVVLQAIFTIAMVVSFQNVLAPDVINLGVKLDDVVDEIEGIPEDGQELLNYVVYNAIAKNTSGDNIRTDGVMVREGSFKKTYFEKVDINFVTFIVDIPDLRQSYQVVYEWSDDENNEYAPKNDAAVALCPEAEQLIYGEFNCDNEKGWWRRYYASTILQAYGNALPDYEYVDSFSKIEKSVDAVGELPLRTGISAMPQGAYSSDDFRIKINYVSCDTQCGCLGVDETRRKEAINAYEKFLDRLSFSTEQIPYYFDNCE